MPCERGDELPGSARLPQLVSDTASALGVPVTVRVDGAPRSLAPEAALTAYRTVQEALTNVARHAGQGATASIVLAWATDSLDISVADQGGERPATAGPPGGFGLAWHGRTRRAARRARGRPAIATAASRIRLRLPVRPVPRGERA